MDGLIHATERYLIDNIAPNIAAQYLLIATSWRLSMLEQTTVRYIASHLSKVRAEDPAWASLSAPQCRLLMEYADHTEMDISPSKCTFTSPGAITDAIPAAGETKEEAQGRGAGSVVAEG